MDGGTRIETINCVDYINGPYWTKYTQEERADAISQLPDPLYQLCPDIGSYDIKGGPGDADGSGLVFHVKPFATTSEEIVD